jgi:hypothetical protein
VLAGCEVGESAVAADERGERAPRPATTARIRARTKQGSGCRECAALKQSQTRRARDAKGQREARRAASDARGPVRPPAPPLLVVPDEEEGLTIAEAARVLDRTGETVRNWVRSGRVLAIPRGPGRPVLTIPASEITRILPFVPPKSGGDKAA